MKKMVDYELGEAINTVITRNREARPCDAGVPTGFRDIDKIIKGFQPSELTIIAGRPGMGKTSFWTNVISYIAFSLEMNVGVFVAKEGIHKVGNMFITQYSHVEIKHIETGRLDKKEFEKVEMTAMCRGDGNITFSTPKSYFGNFDCDELYFGIKKIIETSCVDVIVVDSLQDITIDNKCDKDKYIKIVKGLRELTITFQIPIVLISSLPAEIDDRENHYPTIDDLRSYGHIDSYAGTIILMYRDSYYNKDTERQGIAEFEIVKGGEIRTGRKAELAWLPEFLKFATLEPEDNDM